jgi:hypothetical protein
LYLWLDVKVYNLTNNNQGGGGGGGADTIYLKHFFDTKM